MDDLELIDSTVRYANHHWFTGICSLSNEFPQDEINSAAYFDEVVANTKHIFVPALDDEGYIVWSPELPDIKLTYKNLASVD